jgi:hypothetical protein
MSVNVAPQIPVIPEGETNNFAVSWVRVLDPGELLTGTPLVVEETTSDLTITNKTISTATLSINGRDVVAGQAVQFVVSGQIVAHSPYTLKLTVTTNSTPPQTKIRDIRFSVEAL